MRSHSYGHYPQVRFSEGQKWLFNPVLKKRFANRPEERVRLQYVEYLLRETTLTKNRIGFEALVKAYARDNSLRADLVIFDKDISPLALIECKSESVQLTGKTAEQTARYNLTLQADYLMITNGKQDFWYRRNGQSVAPVESHPFESASAPTLTSDYWKERGFLDAGLSEDILLIASRFLSTTFEKKPESVANITYLNLPSDIAPIPLSHFYRIGKDENNQLAFSLVAAPGQTLFTAMLNRDGQNRGIITIPFTELIESEEAVAQILLPEKVTAATIPAEVTDPFRNPSVKTIKKLIKHLIKLFD